MGRRASSIELSNEEREYLELQTRARTIQAQTVTRARILLLRADSVSIDAIADKVGLNRCSVMLCLKKFKEGGIENALFDAPGRGRNAEITDEEKAWIINIACQKPIDFGYAAEAAGYTRLSTIHKSTVNTILDEADIKPHKITYYCENRDPDFDSKMHNVLLVYKQLEMQFDESGKLIISEDTPIHVLSYDEKPGIQAIATTSDDLRPTEGNGCVYRDYEYKRLGTLSLIAGIDLLTGIAIPVVSETHKSSDFICLLKKLDEMYLEGDVIRIICDNHSAHKSKEVQNYLATKPEGRYVFVFTPKHASWLNLIECFFSKMTKQMLKGIRVKSKQELADRIYQYFDEINKEPVVFHWTYKLDEISEEEANPNMAS